MLLDERARDDEDLYELMGMPERFAPSLAPRTDRVPFVLGIRKSMRVS